MIIYYYVDFNIINICGCLTLWYLQCNISRYWFITFNKFICKFSETIWKILKLIELFLSKNNLNVRIEKLTLTAQLKVCLDIFNFLYVKHVKDIYHGSLYRFLFLYVNYLALLFSLHSLSLGWIFVFICIPTLS